MFFLAYFNAMISILCFSFFKQLISILCERFHTDPINISLLQSFRLYQCLSLLLSFSLYQCFSLLLPFRWWSWSYQDKNEGGHRQYQGKVENSCWRVQHWFAKHERGKSRKIFFERAKYAQFDWISLKRHCFEINFHNFFLFYFDIFLNLERYTDNLQIYVPVVVLFSASQSNIFLQIYFFLIFSYQIFFVCLYLWYRLQVLWSINRKQDYHRPSISLWVGLLLFSFDLIILSIPL